MEKEYFRCDINTKTLDSFNISYDKACYDDRIIIHNWENLSVVDQKRIDSDMKSQGFEEVN